jgi:hypothetical protein
MYETIGDKIKVLAVFENSVVTPRLFRLQNRDYKIKSVSLRYQEKSGASVNHFFAVETEEGGVFKIRFNDKSLVWNVDEVWSGK